MAKKLMSGKRRNTTWAELVKAPLENGEGLERLREKACTHSLLTLCTDLRGLKYGSQLPLCSNQCVTREGGRSMTCVTYTR